jgi:membrane-associated phospholipid phosphatase
VAAVAWRYVMGYRPGTPSWVRDAERIDVALYAAVAATPTPALDRAMRRLTAAADYSRLSLAAAAALAVTRGERGRRAAGVGLASVAVTSALVNLAIKPLARRRRPDRDTRGVPLSRHVPMPASRSFPSGHTASAFAFATAVGHVLPRDALALRALAAAVGYSRVHVGVHFPGDVLLGALIGTSAAQITAYGLERRATR